MIDAAGNDAVGALDPALRAGVLARHREQALDLVGDALNAWRDTGYTRYDDREVSCTVRVLDAMLTILREREQSELMQIFPQIEGTETTRGQLAGRSDFSKAKRADLVLYLGGCHSHRICVECKRLFKSANGSGYAKNGILRFVRGDYSNEHGKAFMVGYVMSKTVSARVEEINTAVSSLSDLGQQHRLTPAPSVQAITDVHSSVHPPTSLVITHLFVDMRTRKQSYRQKRSTAHQTMP
jgi:hypothetical protein